MAIYDLVVVGNGDGAEVAAREAVRRGWRVGVLGFHAGRASPAELQALDCSLHQAAGKFQQSSGPLPGLGDAESRCSRDWPGLIASIRAAQHRTAPSRSAEDLLAAGIELLPGQPSFVGPDMLKVDGHPIRFRHAILAPGLRWARPTGLSDQAEGLTVQTLTGLPRLPEHLAVLGTGPRACAWAQAFRRLGSDVCLVGAESRVLPEEEPMLSAVIHTALAAEGVRLLLDCRRLIVDRIGTQRVLDLQRNGAEEKRFFERVFWEQPLEPDLEGLQLEAAGIAYSSRGVEVNERLQTTNRRVLAIGAVRGQPLDWPEMAEAMAHLAVFNADHRFPRRFNRRQIPRCFWTDPEIARVGLMPSEAVAEHIDLATYRAGHPDLAATRLDGGAEGFVLVHAERGTGRVMGVTVVGDRASELLGAAELMVTSQSSLAAIATLVPCRPTRFKLFERIAEAYCEEQPHSKWQRLRQKARAWKKWVVGSG